MTENNQKIAEIFYKTAELLEIKGVAFKPLAYRKAAKFIEGLEKDLSVYYKDSNNIISGEYHYFFEIIFNNSSFFKILYFRF